MASPSVRASRRQKGEKIMRKWIITALMAATALPAAASAQSNGEVRHDRRDVRHEQRELDQARRTGDRRDVRDARHELREDVNDRNRRWARNDWNGWRNQNRAIFARGNWNAPFRYNAFRVGVRIAPAYYGPRFFVADPWRYHLPPAGFNQRWVRHYNDLLLVDVRRGIVIDVIRNFYW
jgi:Ni/Co efflux regulator RcnB